MKAFGATPLSSFDQAILAHAKTLKASFALEFIDIAAASGIDDAVWEPFQLDFLNEKGRFAIWSKSRQIAWSFTAALDAVVDSILSPGTPHLFVSINLEEAKEKIRYSKQIIRAIRPDARPRIIRQSLTQIEFENGSRLISYPCRPVRGPARARVYLDEMAHYLRSLEVEIYRASLPAISKGDGYIRAGSSPSGASGLFWEIFSQQNRKYPGFKRYVAPWWSIAAFCTNPAAARRLAPGMTTEDRVARFGSVVLQEIFDNMHPDDFRQEYECLFLDEIVAWITWEVIRRCQEAGRELVTFRANGVDQALSILPEIAAAIKAKEIESVLVGGIDIGRHKNTTEFVILGKSPAGSLPLRVRITLDGVEYDDQERVILEYAKRLPFTTILVDQNGLGDQLAENCRKKTRGLVQGVTFSMATKELWGVHVRIEAERGRTPIPLDNDLAYQIHSVKRKTTAAGNTVFDVDASEKHHADAFWAWALSVWAGTGSTKKQARAH